MANFISDQNFEILNYAYFGLEDDQDMARITPEGIYDAVTKIVHPDADAVFVSCTGIRTVETIQKLEKRLNKPVFSSNQCMFWQSLRLTGYKEMILEFGRLLML